MENLSLSDSSIDWRATVEHVVRDNVTVDIQSGDATVARISPVVAGPLLRELNVVLAGVPPLDDVEAFERDLQTVRDSLPLESDSWD